MSEAAVAMDEIVVAGYGSKREMASKAVSMAAEAGHGYHSFTPVNRFNNNFNTEGYAV